MKVNNEQIEADEDVANLNYLNGRREGIKEVAEWVEENVAWRLDAPYKSAIDMVEWQAKLKEWQE